jgi:hypothetical protein
MTLRALAASAAVAALLPATFVATAAAHTSDPGYRSIVRGISPQIPGLTIQVLNYDNQLKLINQTGKTVQINGYEGEPYVKILADGTVEQNQNSPATYTNEERFGGTAVPKNASAKATPDWKVVDSHGQFIWHDHRMHWMSHTLPPSVHDKHLKTKIFDYHVPMLVGGQKAAINGVLFWTGIPKGDPVLLFALLPILAVLGLALVWWRRRRGDGGHRDEADDPAGLQEAW